MAHGGVVGVFRPQFDVVGAEEEALDGGLLAADEGHHDFTVLGILARLADHEVAVQNARPPHGVPPHPQGKQVRAAENLGVHRDAAVPVCLGVHRKPRRDAPDDRDVAAALQGRDFAGTVQQVHRAAVMARTFHAALGLQRPEGPGDGRVAHLQVRGGFAQTGGPVVGRYFPLQVVQKALLGRGQGVHHVSPSTCMGSSLI